MTPTPFRKELLLLAVPLGLQFVFVGLLAAGAADARAGYWAAPAALGLAATGVGAWLYRRGTTARLAALTETTRRLAAGEPLPPPPGGNDPIAALDRAVREMAGRLALAIDRHRESARRIQDLYDHAPCGYHSLDQDGTVVAMNETELRWLGYDRAAVVGKVRFADLLTPAGRDRFRDAFPRFKERGAIRNVEFEMVRKDGSTFHVLLSATALRDPDGRYLASRSTVVDITDRKRAEDEIRRLNAELEDRVRARTAELAEANRDLRQKNDENEMFVYSVSHDLRSPLVNLQGFGKELDKGCQALAALLAEDGVPPPVREKGQALVAGKIAKSLGFIQSSVLRLSGIIDALLRLSRAGRVEYRWEAVDLNRVVARVVGAAQATVAETGATVAVGDLPPAWGDPTALEQAFANLIGNALNYLDPARPGVVEVGYRAAGPGEPGADGPAYFVRDNGLGIAPAHQAKIFQVFQRAHPGVGKGEGIGLAIVARVAERHRGRVWVESRAGEGSTFYLSLRAAPDPPRTPAPAGPPHGSGVDPWLDRPKR